MTSVPQINIHFLPIFRLALEELPNHFTGNQKNSKSCFNVVWFVCLRLPAQRLIAKLFLLVKPSISPLRYVLVWR